MRIGSLFWARTRRGAAILAIPAPATLDTNCRRDIVIGSSPERYIWTSAFVYFVG
jgi:hypothetical protein